MDDNAADNVAEPAFKFKKRRKTTQTKRTRLEFEDDVADGLPVAKDIATAEDDDTSLRLREAIRSRKTPRDRAREAAALAELKKAQALVQRQQEEAPKQDYFGRFVPQTGQVLDRDEKKITEYVEAVMAEKKHREYGYEIPKHLVAAVAALPPKPTAAPSPPATSHTTAGSTKKSEKLDDGKGHRLAAGMGKLEEVDLGPTSTSRAEEEWKRLESGQTKEEPARKVRLGRDGKPRWQPKRRNSEDIRRDAAVEEVLREAKLDYFQEEEAPSDPGPGHTNTEEALVERFHQEYLDSQEARQQRKPAVPANGAKEAPKGPKLGGSRSARAAMQAQMEQDAKNKR